ncbi:hypothetical protein RN001_012005 [Aquatica leii]|uniref:Proteasome-associated protein ECM29 homolog n=1 Tax=Aquatica leii TaxID=1421715 RepID=A0AAN7QEF0_9COLE|nr:hypothetical protein RN001_012005 [Aquatica leii]
MYRYTIFYYILWFITNLPLIDATNSYSFDTNQCTDICSDSFFLLPKDDDSQKECQRGCRFSTIIDLTAKGTLSDTKNDCYESCIQSYIMKKSKDSCVIGCDAMVLKKQSELHYIFPYLDQYSMNDQEFESIENDFFLDPLIRQQVQQGHNIKYKIPEAYIRTLPVVLLERVFLRIGAAETDEQLQNVVSKFLPPVLLKLSSQQEGVRKKVMELLVHINKRIKSRPLVQLPVEALLVQYQDPAATAFVINFTIIYIKLGFPRLPEEKQVELIPSMLNSIDSKPQSHQDSLILLIVPLLGKVVVPMDSSQKHSVFGLNEKVHVKKHMLGLLLDMLLLPYGMLTQKNADNEQNSGNEVSLPVPPGMSEYSFKRVTNEFPLHPEELEQIKLGIVKFLASGIFSDEEILIHLIVAASDTRFSIANLADLELKKVVGAVDWSSTAVSMPLYLLYLGSQSQNISANMKKSPANTRIRLKLLTHMCRISGSGFTLPASIQIIFDSLYGVYTNSKLKTLALNFAMNLVRTADETQLNKVVSILQTGLQKLIREGEATHQGQAYLILGVLGSRFPLLTYHNVALLELFFKNLETAEPELRLQIRQGFLSLIPAYKYDVNPKEYDKDGRVNFLFALVKYYLFSEEPMVRFVAVRSIGTIFPPNHVPSKFLLLLATGDSKDEVYAEAYKSLYGTSVKTEVDLTKVDKTESKVILPAFDEIMKYVYEEAEIRVKDGTKRVNIGNHVLPFTTNVFLEILIYLRLCLIQDLNVPLKREIMRHPCEYTPIIRNKLQTLYNQMELQEKNSFSQYASFVRQLFIANPVIEPLCYMVEIIGCVPKLASSVIDKINWIRDLLNSAKEEIREIASLLYALIINEVLSEKEFEAAVNYLISQTKHKTLEIQHGVIFGLGYTFERRIMAKQPTVLDFTNNDLFKSCVENIVSFLTNSNPLIVSAASEAIGQIGKSMALPLDNGKAAKNGSPDAKRPANGKITKMDVTNQLLQNMNNNKLSSKIRERSAKSLGLICVGEIFPHTKEVIQGFLNTAKETKDIEVHFTIGESLVMCVQSIWSPEARDAWMTLPTDFTPNNAMMERAPDGNLNWLLDELLRLVGETHPNSRQASCIWLLALLKNCSNKEPVKTRLSAFQNAFLDLLGENNDIVQDVASKGLCLVYDNSKSEELLNTLVNQLTTGRRQVAQVTSDTKLFEHGELGKAPTGGNLSTYKELCSLASDLNKPDLLYQFMHIANHNAIWNSKKGAAFGFSSLAEKCGEQLQQHLPKIIPKLYRYQYDPTPNIQLSMQNIWHALVTDTQKTLDQYYDEILADLLENLTSSQYRVRQSCCFALQDFFTTSGNRSIHDAVDRLDELWHKLFRVMDDHHEATRLAATKTTKLLSKLCIRACDITHGKAGVKMVQTILPVLLQEITNSVAEVRSVCLQTLSEIVVAAGDQLKPFLAQLIPALLQATGELESSKLSHWSTMLSGQNEAQEIVDSARANIAKSHFTMETVSKCLQYADASILEELTPKVIELMKSSVRLGTRIVCAHFTTLLIVQMKQDLQPYAGKYLSVLVNGLTDRNVAIRKHYATTIGHLVSVAKESSVEKLFKKIQHWYFEREDDSIRSACAQTIQAIGNYSQEVLKQYSGTILPLVFFAMHAEKNPDTENTVDIWTEIWSENSPGTEYGIRQNVEVICSILKEGLESPSWTMKAQAANAISTVAIKLGSSIETKHRDMLLQILLNGLSGRTWNGKDKLLNALASICSGCKDTLKDNKDVDINNIIEVMLRESRKDEIVYKTSSLKSLGEVLSSLEIDKFEEVYNIAQSILSDRPNSAKDDDEDMSSEEITTKRENVIKIKEIVYETLGKAWPKNSKSTQEKFRELFVEHCKVCLPSSTRSIQVHVISALRDYVEKLSLLEEERLTQLEEESLTKIVDNIIEVATYALGISKHTRLRKDTLSVLFVLTTKLKEKKRHSEINKISKTFYEVLPELVKDNQPEIKSRVTDIKNLLAKD